MLNQRPCHVGYNSSHLNTKVKQHCASTWTGCAWELLVLLSWFCGFDINSALLYSVGYHLRLNVSQQCNQHQWGQKLLNECHI